MIETALSQYGQKEIEGKKDNPTIVSYARESGFMWVNDDETASLATQVALQLFPDFEIDRSYQVMVSEDMAFFMQEVPGCYLLIGASNKTRNLDAPHHNPRFDFDEEVLPIGVGLLAACAWRLQEGVA